MKKLTTIIAAMAAVLLTGACNKAEVEHEGSAVTLDYTVSLAEAATKDKAKAIGDGTTVNKMVYAIFEGETCVKTAVIDEQTEGKFAFQPALYYGKTYTVAMFAYTENAYNVNNIKAITRTQNGEAADAFSYTETIKITQDGKLLINGEKLVANTTRDVTLTRPVAQLAIGTVASDFQKSGVTSVEVTVKEYDVASYNAKEKKCNSATVSSDLTYVTSDFTGSDTFMVGLNTYKYVSVNYLFSKVETEDVKTVVITLKNGNNVVRTIELLNVPLVANKKTQIYGNLVKGDIKFNVTVSAGFDAWDPSDSDNGKVEIK